MASAPERPLPPPRLTGQRRRAQLNREMEERAVAHSEDPERMERARRAVGYQPPSPPDNSARARRRVARGSNPREQEQQQQQQQQQEVEQHGGLGSEVPPPPQKKKTSNFRKQGEPPKAPRFQFDANAIRNVISTIMHVATSIQTIQFVPKPQQQSDEEEDTNDEEAAPLPEPPMHSMMLIILDEGEKQTNVSGGGLNNRRAAKPKLTVVAHDAATAEKIFSVAHDAHRTDADGDAPYTKVFVGKKEGMTLIESCAQYCDQLTAGRKQPSRSGETNANVQRNHITPRALNEAQISPPYSGANTPPSVAVAVANNAANHDETMEVQMQITFDEDEDENENDNDEDQGTSSSVN